MKVSTEIDNNFGYEKITQLVDNIPLIRTSILTLFLVQVLQHNWKKPIQREITPTEKFKM
jgi:hypothetical protein